MLNNKVPKIIIEHATKPQKHIQLGKDTSFSMCDFLAVIRFFRNCLFTKDPVYAKFIIKNDLFKPLHTILMNNLAKDNLLNSTVVDVLHFIQEVSLHKTYNLIRQENIKSMVSYIIEKYGPSLKGLTYVDTFDKLQIKYEQNQEFTEFPR